jgi:hypothetical protein
MLLVVVDYSVLNSKTPNHLNLALALARLNHRTNLLELVQDLVNQDLPLKCNHRVSSSNQEHSVRMLESQVDL